MSDPLEAQIRALADLSVGQPAAGGAVDGADWAPDDLEAYAAPATGGPRRSLLLVALAGVVVLALIAGVALIRRDDQTRVAVNPEVEVDPALVRTARTIAAQATERSSHQVDEVSAVVTTAGQVSAAAGCSADEEFVVYQVVFDLPIIDSLASAPAGASPPTGRAMQFGRPGPPGADPTTGCGSYYGLTAEPEDLALLGDPVVIDVRVDPAEFATTAVWTLGEGEVVDASATAFIAGVTRLACSDGVTEGVRAPTIELGPDSVVVTFTVDPLPPGFYTCPGGEPVPVRVDLGEPLGDRVLLDGACLGAGPASTTSRCSEGGRRQVP